MRLKNKKTGEIIDVYKGEITLHYNQGRETIHFKRLEDLEEWEDYEKQQFDYWYIEGFGTILHHTKDIRISCDYLEKSYERQKQIGNYFKAVEEAEKAVEKLKAWKRLKDKGFKFTDWNASLGELYFKVPESFFSDDDCITVETRQDLDLLFRGEE